MLKQLEDQRIRELQYLDRGMSLETAMFNARIDRPVYLPAPERPRCGRG